MSLPGSSASALDGSLIATHTISAKELLVNVPADGDGHVIGTRTEWFIYTTPLTNAGNAEVGELFNTSTSIVHVRGIWLIPTQSVITAAQIQYSLFRTSTVGSGGIVETPRPLDTGFAALPAGITSRSAITSGSTALYTYLSQWNWNEEQDVVNSPQRPQLNNQVMSMTNLLPVLGDRIAEIELRQNEGVDVRVNSGTTGLISSLWYFAVDN